jgi:excisionase family DNA binding protein
VEITGKTKEKVMLERLFSVGEAAATLGGVSKWTVHSWIAQGKLARTKIGGRTMISESDLRKLFGVHHKI